MKRLMHASLLILGFSRLGVGITPFPVATTTCETCAYVTWQTDVAGTSQVNYGLTPQYGLNTTASLSYVNYHLQVIAGLSQNSTYHFRVVSVDSNGNVGMSGDYTFTTLAGPTGTVYQVDSAGGGNYATVSACLAAAKPGWTCEVYAGTDGIYPESGAPIPINTSGTGGSPISLIAHDLVLVPGFVLTNASYVNIAGFEISTGNASFAGLPFQNCSTESDGVLLTSSNYVTLQSNYINYVYHGIPIHGAYQVNSNYLRILGNITDYADMFPGGTCASSPEGMPGIEAWGNHILVDGNSARDVDRFIEVEGAFNIFRRNVFHDTQPTDWGIACATDHVDFFHPLSAPGFPEIHHVYENNQDYNRPCPDEHFLLYTDYNGGNSWLTNSQYQSLGTGNGTQTSFTTTLSWSGSDVIAPFSLQIPVSSTVGGSDNGFGSITGYGLSGSMAGYANGSPITVNFSVPPASGTPLPIYYSLTQSNSHDAIIRFNTVANLGSYFFNGSTAQGIPGVRLHNNTLYQACWDNTGAPNGAPCTSLSGLAAHWADLNEIYYSSWKICNGPPWGIAGANGQYLSENPFAVAPQNNLLYSAFGTSCPAACNFSLTNSYVTYSPIGLIQNQLPLFNNPALNDFSLSSTSPALGAGTYLTAVASSDTGSGTSLIVNDAGFFQDGYGISGVQGDCIMVGTSVSSAVKTCIATDTYASNTLTISPAITRSAGMYVWLYSDSTGRVVLGPNGPNIGAGLAAQGNTTQ